MYREAVARIPAIAQQLIENQQINTQGLDQEVQKLINAFNIEFQKDPQSAMNWLNNLQAKTIPYYQKEYEQRQQNGGKSMQPGKTQPSGQQTGQTQTQATGAQH